MRTDNGTQFSMALAGALADLQEEMRRRPRLTNAHRPWLGVAMATLAAPCALAQTAGGAPRDTQLDQVVIKATRVQPYEANEPSIQKLTQSMVDTPQAITTVTRAELDDRAATTLNDALRTVPGISLGAGETSFQGNNIILRGFTTRNDMFLDGQRDYGYYYRDPFNTQDVEVLKGPSSILFGRGSTGGVINQVSKAPTLAAELLGTGLLSTASVRRATLDLDTPAQAFGEGAAVRVNLMGDHTETADRDTVENDRWGVAPSLAFGLGTPTRLVVSYLHQSDNGTPDYGIPWLFGRPAPVERNNYYGFSSDYLRTEANVVTARVEHSFNPTLLLSSQLRYSHDTREFRYTEAVIPASATAATPIAAITVSRNEFQGFSTDTFLQNQWDVTAKFSTGGLTHALVTGFELGRENPQPTYVTNVGVPTTNLATPQDLGYTVTQSYTRLTARTVAKSMAAYALDTIEIGGHWQVMGGVRWDRFDAVYHSTGYAPTGAVAANTAVDSNSDGFSYRGAVVHTPTAQSSIYASYGTSFNPSAEGIESLISAGRSVSQANLNLAPEKSRNYEVGGKWSVSGGRLLLTTAVFRIEKTNVRVPDPTLPGFNTLGGDQRVDGAEVEAMGRLTTRWTIRAGYTYLDSETTRSASGGPLVGKALPGTPGNSFSVFTEYRFAPRFEAGFGALSMSSRLGQNTAAQYEVTPGYTTLEAMAKYLFTANLSLQLNVNNLTNRAYLDALHPAHVIPGEGRVARLSINVKY